MKGLWIIAIVSLCLARVEAQVFPGDANYDGIVDNHDILPIGYAFGSIGPARLDSAMGNMPEQFEITAYWQDIFPNGINYAHADTDGTGLVDVIDLLNVFLNYHEEHSGGSPSSIFEGTENIDIPLFFDTPDLGNPLTPGSSLEIPLNLGTEDLPADSVHGIAFSIHYDIDFFESVELNLTNQWMDNNLFQFEAPLTINNEGPRPVGVIDVALTHFGRASSSNGFGQIGALSIIIEDVLVGLMPINDSTNVKLSIEDVRLIDKNYEVHPVVWDELLLKVYNSDAMTVSDNTPKKELAVDVFPNPFTDEVYLYSGADIQNVRVYDLLGRKIWAQAYDGQKQLTLNRSSFGENAGTYIVRVQTIQGVFQRKLVLVE